MKLTIKKTIEETIEINEFPKYYRHPWMERLYKITREGLMILTNEHMVFWEANGSKYFTDEITEVIKYGESTEVDYQNLLNKTINKLKSI